MTMHCATWRRLVMPAFALCWVAAPLTGQAKPAAAAATRKSAEPPQPPAAPDDKNTSRAPPPKPDAAEPAPSTAPAPAPAAALPPALPTAPKATATPACDPPSQPQSVPDSAPIKRCPRYALESGCALEDGRQHGAWTVWSPEQGCELPLRTETFVEGRRNGLAAVWRAHCPVDAKGVKLPCEARLAERGALIGGTREGPWEIYDDAGQLFEQGAYLRGRRQGPWRRMADSKTAEIVCFRRDQIAWRGAPDTEAAQQPCPMAIDEGDGTQVVTEAQEQASRFVGLAQRSTNLDLRVRYLRKAVELDPNNAGYRKLLGEAEAQLQERQRTAPKGGGAPEGASPPAGQGGAPQGGAGGGAAGQGGQGGGPGASHADGD